VTGDCGGVGEHGTFRNGSIEEPERSTVVRAMGIRDKPTAPASPWQNGFAERLIGSIRRECVDRIIVLGEMHLRQILQSYARYSWRTSPPLRCVRKSLMLPAGEIPASERGTSRPTGNRALGSWR
jgi:transposase InsO family protein